MKSKKALAVWGASGEGSEKKLVRESGLSFRMVLRLKWSLHKARNKRLPHRNEVILISGAFAFGDNERLHLIDVSQPFLSTVAFLLLFAALAMTQSY